MYRGDGEDHALGKQAPEPVQAVLTQCGGRRINIFGHGNHILSAPVVTVGKHRRVCVCVGQGVEIDGAGIVGGHMVCVATGKRRRMMVRTGIWLRRAFALVIAQGVWTVLVPVPVFQVTAPTMGQKFGPAFFVGVRIRRGQQPTGRVVIQLGHGMVVGRHQQPLHCA